MGVIYREIPPCKALLPYIKCFWTLEASSAAAEEVERIVPDGRMELVFHYGGRFERLLDGAASTQPRGIITGQILRPLFVRPTGAVGMISARFHPFGFSSLFKIPSDELSGNLYAVGDVLGAAGGELEERVLNAASTEERVMALEGHFLARLAARGDHDFRVHRIARRIQALHGCFQAEKLAGEFNIGVRQMERLFQRGIGLRPNVYGRIVRFQHAITLKAMDATMGLTDLGMATGYYDQAHFTKDFKAFSGLTPGQYFRGTHQMADHFAEIH